MFHKCSSQPMWVLSVWETKELTCFCWSSNTGCDTGRVWYLPSNGNIVDLGLVRREFRRRSEVPTVGSSNVSRLTDLDGSLSWSYRTCSVFITDVSGMDDQRPTASFQMPWGSEVPTWAESSDTSQTSTQLLSFQICWGSGVLTWVGSSDIHWEFRRLTLIL